ncbi:pyridoxamine 5'-phosphate oxidase family protein [Kitasatospora nipponensis]|uniref:Pyridoxamine 5'-phosphate oxidase family protein n=1 Tax=Kitasatospora nipponensis TaxID=258049 RepID=A0ABP4GKY9_9ACTN
MTVHSVRSEQRAEHTGEREVRRRAGLDRPGYRGPSKFRQIPAVAADFLADQPMLVLGAADAQGRLWAGLLTGRPGFLRAEPGSRDDPAPDGPALGPKPDPVLDTLTVEARPLPGDPLAAALDVPAAAGGTQVGLIAIEPARRRRMRLNGSATATGSGLRVTLDQVFSNCPKYIQDRSWRLVDEPSSPPVHGTELTLRQQLLISTADTFFLTTADRDGELDASHRGGNPGFVRVEGPDRLVFPDYVGNAMFCTLGNLLENPAAGLLFLDWETGTTLQLSGTASTDWDPAHAATVPGAERLVEFTVQRVVETPAASPLRWTEAGYSRFNPPTSGR